MNRVGLYNVDSKHPNFALMKISSHHKSIGDKVSWYSPIEAPCFDMVYASAIFTYSPKDYVTDNMILGGTGFNIKSKLPDEIEDGEPDYSLYPDFKQAMGFLTRGCIRKCQWCFVPEKEGELRPYRDTDTIAQGRREVILMDNNFLAAGDWAQEQAERIINGKYKVDFNQGLDARLIDNEWAKTLSKMKWFPQLRMACDTSAMIEPVIKATELLRKYGCKPVRYSVYTLVKDLDEAYNRVMTLAKYGLYPFAQPYIDKENHQPPEELKRFARWVNHKAVFKSVKWEDYVD